MLGQLKGVTMWSQGAFSCAQAQGGCKSRTRFVLQRIELVYACVLLTRMPAQKAQLMQAKFWIFVFFFFFLSKNVLEL